jgi:uncharacterized membrane protein
MSGPGSVSEAVCLGASCYGMRMSASPPASAVENASHLRRGPSATVRLSVSLGVGVLGGVVVGILAPWWLIPLSVWDIGALVLVSWLWHSLLPLDPAETAAHARRENPGRAEAGGLLLGASVASLLAVGLVLVRAGHSSGLTKGLLVGLSVASVVLAWSVVHTVFSLRYAKLYYQGEGGGVDFNEEEPPCYTDFAYLALTIGMTFQVSDTNLKTKEIRRTALRHALLSYVFGALIIATTINLIAGLTK